MSGGGKKCQTVGYWYGMGLHFGVCHGPVDALLAIESGGRIAWSGAQSANGDIAISRPDLYGGEEREGGIDGTLSVMMGGPTQTANSYLASVQGTPQPAYRGILGCVFRGWISANNPYVKPWAFRVRRTLAGWGTAVWYPAKAEITLSTGDKAANPAHIIYECLTNPDWGMGYNPGMIDAASFAAAADLLHAEGFGLCIQWAKQTSIEAFIQSVADHAGLVVGQSRHTGLFTLRAVRGGYSIPALMLLDPSNVLEVHIERATGAESVNEITVQYIDVTTGQEAVVTMQNMAAIQSQGGVVSQTLSYPGLPTAQLAGRVAARDLRVRSTPLARLRLRTNRRAWQLAPGDVARITWPQLGITNMPIRILAVDYGSLTDGIIQIDAAEDVFGLPNTAYTAPQANLWAAPSTAAHPSPHVEAWEATYRDLVLAYGHTLSLVDATTCHLIAAAARPPGLAMHYELRTRIGSSGPYKAAGDGDWSPTALLSTAIGPTQTNITLTSGSRLDAVEVGSPAMLGSEIVRISAIDPQTGAATIERGCVDTVPTAHAAGTRLWVWHGFGAFDTEEYAPGETAQAKYITVTTAERLSETSAPSDAVTMSMRQHRPYPPGNVRLNGASWPSAIMCAATLTWAHRDRITQADQIVPHSAGNIGPESGTTYTVRWYDETGVLRRTHTGITGTSQTWTTEVTDCGRWQGRITVEVESVRGGVVSHQYASVTADRAGWGLQWGRYYGGLVGHSCAGQP